MNEEPQPNPEGASSAPDRSEAFWERRDRISATRRNFFWLLMGALAAFLLFGGGGTKLFTPQ